MKKILALFDFDGTITTLDSSQYFYRFLYSSRLSFFFNNYILCLWHIVLYRMGVTSYFSLKNYRLNIHTSKLNNTEFQTLTREFYSKHLISLLNPKAIDRIQWHKNQGHEVWVISASYDFLLNQWAIDTDIKLITNKTAIKQSARHIIGKDVNYDEKVKYLRLKINLKDYTEIYAYGDSEGDKAMLSIANFQYYKPFRN